MTKDGFVFLVMGFTGKEAAKFNCGHMTTVAQDGKIREMLSLPLQFLNGLWYNRR